MYEANEVKQNTVPAENQLQSSSLLQLSSGETPKLKILFVGNSITYHAQKPEIGWLGSWGMAASKAENDYIHQSVKKLKQRYGTVGFGIAQLAEWELHYEDKAAHWQLPYVGIKEFAPDITVIRMGENIPAEKMEQLNPKSYIADMIAFFGNGCRQVIVTDCFWKRDKLDCILKEICDEKGYTFCEISDLYEDKRTMALGEYEHQGVALHPSDYGMERIAERIVEKIGI